MIVLVTLLIYALQLSTDLRKAAPATREHFMRGNEAQVAGHLTKFAGKGVEADSIREQLSQAVTDFYTVWTNAWKESERRRFSPVSWFADSIYMVSAFSAQMEVPARLVHSQCRTGMQGWDEDQLALRVRLDYKAVTGVRTAYSVCPSWRLNALPQLPDEDHDIDAAIEASLKQSVRDARGALIQRLAFLAAAAPSDQMVVGQRVRFLVQQRLFADAHAATRTCRAVAWWCTALDGYVSEREGSLIVADSAFKRARAQMPGDVRCEWDDIRVLVPELKRDEYVKQSCTARESINNNFWWMSDPLFSEPGNERKTVHDARRITILLNSAFDTDGRFRWDVPHVGAAMQKTILRYGWPSYVAWGMPSLDSIQDQWLVAQHALASSPYTTFEYSTGRVHTVPDWSAVLDPLTVADSMWDMNARWEEDLPSVIWWPIEHFARSRPLLNVRPGQVAMLRRQNDIILVAANDVDSDSKARLSASRSAALIVSPDAETVTVLQQKQTSSGETLALHGRIPSQPTVMGVEIRDRSPAGTDLRTRFGIVPLQTLAVMKPGEVAVSQPMLVRAPSDASELQSMGDSVINRMYGSTQIRRRDARVGVYWESYGFASADSVTVAVRLERRVVINPIQRLGMALKIAGNPKSPLTITWREPDPGRSVRTISEGVPVQTRSLVLNIAQLKPGNYELIVQVSRPGTAPAENRRALRIVQ